MNGCETKQGGWPMRLAQYQVRAGRKMERQNQAGWQDRHESAYQKQKTKQSF